jgi:DNA-binding NarL/FixJ family response regulator
MSSAQPQNSTQSAHSPARKNNPILLLVDDEAGQRERYRFVIRSTEELDYLELLEASDIDEALEILAGTPVHAVLLDKNIELGPDRPTENGIEAIPDFLRLQPHLQILVLTGSKDIPDVVRAMKLGAANYIVKETPSALLCSQIDRAVHVASLKLGGFKYVFFDFADLGWVFGYS